VCAFFSKIFNPCNPEAAGTFIFLVWGFEQHEVTITIDDEESSRAAPETLASHPLTNLARTRDPQYVIIPVGSKNADGSPEESSQERPDCTICLDQCSEPYCQLVKCKHYFCTSCIDQWLAINPHCPVCRSGPEELPRTNAATLTQSGTVSDPDSGILKANQKIPPPVEI
jgi:hypothetical protein